MLASLVGSTLGFASTPPLAEREQAANGGHVNIPNHPCAYGFTSGEVAPGRAMVSGYLPANTPKPKDGLFCPHHVDPKDPWHSLDTHRVDSCYRATKTDAAPAVVDEDDGIMIVELDASGEYPANEEYPPNKTSSGKQSGGARVPPSLACRMPEGAHCEPVPREMKDGVEQDWEIPDNYGVLISWVVPDWWKHDETFNNDTCFHGDVKVHSFSPDYHFFAEGVAHHQCGWKVVTEAIVYVFVKKGDYSPVGADSVYCPLLPDGVNFDGEWVGAHDSECTTDVSACNNTKSSWT